LLPRRIVRPALANRRTEPLRNSVNSSVEAAAPPSWKDPALRRTMFNGSGPLPALAHLKASMMRSPLEITAGALLLFPELDLHSNVLFSAYDDFLGILADDDKRGSLKNMPFEDLPKSPIFKEARLISYRFRDAVSSIFLKPDNLLGKLTIEYGVF
jgi:hypothetical protein